MYTLETPEPFHVQSWTPKMCSLLLYWKQYYSFSSIMDLFHREFSFPVTRDACMGKYRRLMAKKAEYDPEHVKEYMHGFKE